MEQQIDFTNSCFELIIGREGYASKVGKDLIEDKDEMGHFNSSPFFSFIILAHELQNFSIKNEL